MLILTIDQGTHSTRAIIFNGKGRVVSMARQAITLNRKSRREVEQSADEIRQSMLTVIDKVLGDPDINGEQIVAAGLATQRSSVLAWDRATGMALSPVLSWQDRRVADTLLTLSADDRLIREKTGLQLSPHYGAGKLQWLIKHVPEVEAALANGSLVMGPLAAYLLHHLTDSPDELVDDANASRTLLWNLKQRNWDDSLLELFQIPAESLPACVPICSHYGHTRQGNIPLLAVNGDQTAALYAQGKPSANTILVNIGTGAFVLLATDEPTRRPEGLLAGISLSDKDTAHYYIEGTVNGAAAAVKWAAKKLSIDDVKQQLPGWLEDTPSPPLFMNTVGGLGAPWWIPGPEPHFSDTNITAAEAMVAVIESIVFLLQANIDLMQLHNPGVDKIRASGGLSNLDSLCQKLANLSGLHVERPVQTEATARGIAWQAAGCQGDWDNVAPGKTFTPQTDTALAQRYSRFSEKLKQFGS
jgi:glycerol kinase